MTNNPSHSGAQHGRRRSIVAPRAEEEDLLTVSLTAQHHRQTARSLMRRLRRFEVLYEMPSSELDDALEAGRLPDTAHVARWVVTWRAYQRLAAGTDRPTRRR